MRSDFATYREVERGSLGPGVIGVGTVKMKVRWTPFSSERHIGQLRGDYSGSKSKDADYRRGFYEDHAIMSHKKSPFKGKVLFLTRNGLIWSRPWEPLSN
ncbi:hypothetical protein SBOR_8907 [Sclerotinia borealis F-4128]|uniref:Uncharacterized protein n=1 Tax=Sclerotinia borealis (strain F-4128) TaxID=1432307 RepID=W9C4R6_SCLBF|nr:hypothetical protein SBOR_8907 [Sclerotinia borealis F-4128]